MESPNSVGGRYARPVRTCYALPSGQASDCVERRRDVALTNRKSSFSGIVEWYRLAAFDDNILDRSSQFRIGASVRLRNHSHTQLESRAVSSLVSLVHSLIDLLVVVVETDKNPPR